MRQVAAGTNEVAGDGTTTATVLAQAIVRHGIRNVAAGADPMALRRGIERAVEQVVGHLRDEQSREITEPASSSPAWRRSRPATRRSAA